MICEDCQGTGDDQRTHLTLQKRPCPECGGTGIAYCCEGAPRQIQNGAPAIDPMTGSGLARNMSAYKEDKP